jgi:hypothetical protein
MAYQSSTTFPNLALLHDFKVSTQLPTTITSNYASEYRIDRYANEKNTFLWPSRVVKYSTYSTLYTFFTGVGWMRDSFNFVRPDTGASVVVRLSKPISMQVMALNPDNTPSLCTISDIELVQVFSPNY